MARFPYYKSNTVALGKLLAEARLDPALRERLRTNPAAELRKIGLPEQTTSLFRFEVVDEERDRKCVTIPFRLNSDRLERQDPAYLEAIGAMVAPARTN